MNIYKDFYKEKEIHDSVNLCTSDGKLHSDSIGWSRKPVFNCNLSGHRLRKKKWNYWCITNNECLFSVTISNIDYAGMIFAYFLDFKTKNFIEKTIMTPFGRGCSMPESVRETVKFKHQTMELQFLEEQCTTHILANCRDFNGVSMDADFKVIYPEGHETLNVVVPWSEKMFQFTSKHECLPVTGKLKIGDTIYNFNPENTFACLDFGRGVWPYCVKWNWVNASGVSNGKRIGLNFGAQWTDGTGMTENALLVDGKITKLSEDINFEYDSKDLMKPWNLKTEITDRVTVKFVPFYERIAKSNLVLITSEVHQMIGHFSGIIKTDTGESIIFDSILGSLEEHFGKW